MINIFYKMLIDIFCYFSLSSLFVGALFDLTPDYKMLLFVLIEVIIALIPLWVNKINKYNNYFLVFGLIISILLSLFLDNIVFNIQFIPIWIYLGYIIYKKYYNVRHVDLMALFKNLSIVYLVISFILLIYSTDICIRAISASTVFVIMFLIDVVLLLKRLRETKAIKDKKLYVIKQFLEIIFILALSVLMSIERIKIWLNNLFYNAGNSIYYTLGKILMTIYMFILGIVVKIMTLIYKFMMLFKVERSPEEIEEDLETIERIRAEFFVMYEQPKDYNYDWLKLLYIIIGLVASLASVFLFKYLISLNNRYKVRSGATVLREKINDKSDKKIKKPKRSMKNPRDSIRYYYIMFLKYCISNEIMIKKSDTSKNINDKFIEKQRTDEELSYKLRQIYKKARYDMSSKITKEDVNLARDCLKSIERRK